jgi:DNA invertase Pin-like site-specific DNA recombinase
MADRPEGRRLFDILRAGDTLVVRWVDRLGRNYQDVTGTIREFISRGVVVRTVINNMTFDGSTKDAMQQAVRDALIAFMAATAQAQAEATKEAQRAGIVYAQANDDGTKFRGRKPSFTWDTFTRVQQLLSQGISVAEVAKITGLKRQTVYRILKEPGRQAAALAAWSPGAKELIAA